MKELFSFDDVLIVPKFSLIESRKDVNLSTNIQGRRFDFPVISANMDTITGERMAKAMLEYGGQACLHRFSSIEDNIRTFERSHTGGNTPMVSIGLGSAELERAQALLEAGAHTFIIDVAHGAQLSVVKQTKRLREVVGPYASIVVGNFATGESVAAFLDHSGAIVDGFKVGIGPGSACTTRIKTGVGFPQLSAVFDVANTLKNLGIAVIADGGMKTPGDISKALVAGARAVMLGGMLSGTDETPGDVIFPEGDGPQCPVKAYRGSASKESYWAQGKTGTHRTAEGESFVVPYKGSVIDVLQDIEGGLRSTMTYVNANNLKELHANGEFVRITSATISENGAHGKR